ncbi:hypothetical protein [Rhodococcus sp. IEGM 1379]|uniref:hypothetical protein n=1 Tax=Rhodococcus sp. IEGM 1379 TaxID=3047086 RepID=UPI0024B6625C|nr:hypothetical protein [Rhodococcus sp. IEGM 1379]MDI9915798.1 hypothetical protein [Rhodococcus sp. IEGM 1379]
MHDQGALLQALSRQTPKAGALALDGKVSALNCQVGVAVLLINAALPWVEVPGGEILKHSAMAAPAMLPPQQVRWHWLRMQS